MHLGQKEAQKRTLCTSDLHYPVLSQINQQKQQGFIEHYHLMYKTKTKQTSSGI